MSQAGGEGRIGGSQLSHQQMEERIAEDVVAADEKRSEILQSHPSLVPEAGRMSILTTMGYRKL